MLNLFGRKGIGSLKISFVNLLVFLSLQSLLGISFLLSILSLFSLFSLFNLFSSVFRGPWSAPAGV